MKRRFYPLALLLFLQVAAHSQITDPKATEVWQPEPRLITPGEGAKPPSDAIVLFDGKNLSEWLTFKDSTDAKWDINPDGSITVKPGAGDIFTRRSFGDCQLHLEFRAPVVVKGEGQGRGNSGYFFRAVMKSKCWIVTRTAPIPMAKLALFINKASHWSMYAASLVSGKPMTCFTRLQNSTPMVCWSRQHT